MMIPAIDLIDGQVVRLFQGDYSQKTNYQYTVQERQQAYAQSGATVMHFVDLDGAKDSTKRQLETLKTVVKHPTMTIQVGGGVRCEDDVKQLLALGADRVVIGSLAIKQPELVAQLWADSLNLPLDKISVVDFNHIPLALALSIVNSNSVLLAKDSVRLAKEENRVSSMWELDQMYHRQQFG